MKSKSKSQSKSHKIKEKIYNNSSIFTKQKKQSEILNQQSRREPIRQLLYKMGGNEVETTNILNQKILLYKINDKTNYYGELYYDIQTNKIMFMDKDNKICPIISEKENNASNIEFFGLWHKDLIYNKNCIIRDQFDFDSIYIALNTHHSMRPPNDDLDNWVLLMPSGFTFRGKWTEDETYKHNHCVLDDISNELYICKKTLCKGVITSDNSTWVLFMPTLNDNLQKGSLWTLPNESTSGESLNESLIESKILSDESYSNTVRTNVSFFSIFTTESCCYQYNERSGVSVFNQNKCPHKHDSPELSNMYDFKRIKCHETFIKLPLPMITKNDSEYFDYNNETGGIIIKQQGYYRITYMITYHGSIYDMISSVYNIDESILYSVNKSINRSRNDVTLDTYYDYSGNDDERTDDLMRCINHSFYLPVKNDDVELILTLKLNKHNKNKILYIHPIQTWMTIDKIDN